jgi:hypothetical protein
MEVEDGQNALRDQNRTCVRLPVPGICNHWLRYYFLLKCDMELLNVFSNEHRDIKNGYGILAERPEET